MIVRASDMPTGGKLSDVGQVTIMPLTFGELLKYLGDEQMTPLREYIHALEWMKSIDPNIGRCSLLDADYLLYVFKALSSTKDAKIIINTECQHCHNTHSLSLHLNEIEFRDITDQALKIKEITLSDRKIRFKYVTIDEFILTVGKLGKIPTTFNIDIIKLVSMLNIFPGEALKLIERSVQKDIALINYLDTLLFQLIKPIEIKCPDNPNSRGTTAAFRMSAVDIFRSIIQLNPITNDQISFGEASSSSEHQ